MKAHPNFSHFQIFKASTYKEALTFFEEYNEQKEIKFILLDIRLDAGFTGWDVLASEEFKKLGDTIPVFISSSSNTYEDKLKASSFDCISGYFLKPISQSILDLINTEIA